MCADFSNVIAKDFIEKIIGIMFPGEEIEPVIENDGFDSSTGDQKFLTKIPKDGKSITININISNDGWGGAYTEDGENASRIFIREGRDGCVVESSKKKTSK